MARIKLQKKIPAVANKYIVVGSDGNLTTGDLPAVIYPTVNITVPSNIVSITAQKGDVFAVVTRNSATSYSFNPPQFGYWNITVYISGNYISETVNVTEVTTYNISIS